MANWKDWVSDKVNDALTSGEQHSYYHLLPQRNPNDPVDNAIRSGGTAIANAGEAIGNEASKFGVGPLYQPPAKPINNFAPAQAIDQSRPTMAAALWAGRNSLGINGPQAVPLDEAMTNIGNRPSPPGPAQENKGLVLQPGDQAIGGRFYSGNAGGAAPPAPAARPSEGASMPTEAINPGNELTRWDMARGLQNAGVNVPLMNRQEMVNVLQAKIGSQGGTGGIANIGTLPDNQLRDLMDRHGLNYFKMTDDQMRKAYAPVEQANTGRSPAGITFTPPPEKAAAFEARLKELNDQKIRSDLALQQAAHEFGLKPDQQPQARTTSALFTGGDFSAGNGTANMTPEAKREMGYTMLQNYMKNPLRYGSAYATAAIQAIHEIPSAIEVPASAEAQRQYHLGAAEHYHAQAGLAPSEAIKNEAIAGHYRAEGENKAIPLPPGYELYQTNKERGNPATKIATGAAEKAANPNAQERMSEPDKLNLQGLYHGMSQEMDPDEKKNYQKKIDAINQKYEQPASGGKPMMSRDEAYQKLRDRGYSDKDANDYLDARGFPGIPKEKPPAPKGGQMSIGDIGKWALSPSLYAIGQMGQ